MTLESVITLVLEQQKNRLASRDNGLKRELIPATKSLSSHALITSGVMSYNQPPIKNIKF